ncbi:MAG: hypothetical protein IJK86_02060 [Lachnospiraceae bacterium]|nr:hypothetical protein [Clostridia bacterium]MBQ6074916.1 hypothetical protein [Lachnospiraceae bacterium]
MKKSKVIDISKATFISVCVILLALIGLSVLLTYLVPRGEFALADGVPDYRSYISRPDLSGIPVWKGLLAPFLILGSGDGLSLIMLSVFLLIVSGSFQVLIDSHGISRLVSGLAGQLGKNRRALVLVLALVFMVFGSFFGLFEETLPMVPLVLMFCLGVGYDGFTGFLVSVGSACLGFAAGITNPFTVVLASGLIGTSVTSGILFRCLVFAVMFGLDAAFLLRHLKRIERDPRRSPTFEADERRRAELQELPKEAESRRLTACTLGLLFAAFAVTILFSLSDALRGYTVPAVAGVYLIGILLFGVLSGYRPGPTFRSFGQGIVSALPAILFILLASSVKYILTEGHVLATIAHGINGAVAGSSRLAIVYILLGIILVLEFFISSSTAKAIFVMGILSCLTVPLSRPLLVLIYLFGDGYTNLFFPTSPVLWIGLSMIGMSYGKWLKKSAPLWSGILVLTAALLALAVLLDPIR